MRLNERANAETVSALAPDAVVVATGGQVVHRHEWTSLRRVIADDLLLGHRVVIVGGDLVGVAGAIHLAELGHVVTLLEPGRELAPEVGWKRKTEEMHRLDRLGVTVHVGADVIAIRDAGVRWVPSGGTERELPADDVLVAGVVEPDLTLYDALVARLPGIPVTAIGDATGPGLIRKATEDAARAVAALESE